MRSHHVRLKRLEDKLKVRNRKFSWADIVRLAEGDGSVGNFTLESLRGWVDILNQRKEYQLKTELVFATLGPEDSLIGAIWGHTRLTV